jgi:hypothetical protein
MTNEVQTTCVTIRWRSCSSLKTQYLGYLKMLACVATAWEVGRLPSHIEHGVCKARVRSEMKSVRHECHGFGLM